MIIIFYEKLSNLSFILSVAAFITSVIFNNDNLLHLSAFLMLESDLSAILDIKDKLEKESDNK